jgi:hypothetical protein
MNVPTRADDAREERADDGSEESALENVASDVAAHWQAALFAAGSLAVAYWAAFVQPELSPKGYVPIMVAYALGAIGYVYVTEHAGVRIGSARSSG